MKITLNIKNDSDRVIEEHLFDFRYNNTPIDMLHIGTKVTFNIINEETGVGNKMSWIEFISRLSLNGKFLARITEFDNERISWYDVDRFGFCSPIEKLNKPDSNSVIKPLFCFGKHVIIISMNPHQQSQIVFEIVEQKIFGIKLNPDLID